MNVCSVRDCDFYSCSSRVDKIMRIVVYDIYTCSVIVVDEMRVNNFESFFQVE